MKRGTLLALLVTILFLTGFTALYAGATKEEEKAKEGLTFGMVLRVATSTFHNAIYLGADAKAKELGIEVICKDGANSPERQIELMENFVTMGVDAFILGGTIDQKAIIPGIKALNEANIPVIATDTKPAGGKCELFISFDNVLASEKAGKALIKIFNDEYGKVPEGVVLEITGDLRDVAQALRHKGFRNIVNEEKYPQLTIVEGEGKWNADDAFKVTSDLMTRYGERVVGVFMHTDLMVPGIDSAIRQAGYDPKKIVIVGLDAGPEGLEYMRRGVLRVEPLQDAYAYGQIACKYLYEKLQGKSLPKVGDTVVVEGELWSPAQVVEDPEGVCPIMLINAPMVPWELPLDDPLLWPNLVSSE